jgi:hypothetical protein
MEALTERAVQLEPGFRKSAKADRFGFNAGRDWVPISSSSSIIDFLTVIVRL